MVIAVIGILEAAVTPSVVQRIMDGRVDETRVEAQSLYDGMIGKPGDGRFGFAGDLGGLLASFNELAQQGGLPAFMTIRPEVSEWGGATRMSTSVRRRTTM